jgi:TRAP-type uncharacterized transport system substrate-binding protein
MFASVGTGETNGIYYPLGDVICGIVNQNLRQRHSLLEGDDARLGL